MNRRKLLKKILTECINHMSPAHIERYLSLGGRVDTMNQKATLLCEASRRGLLELARYLIAAGAKVNLPDGNGCSPLYFAATHGNDEVVKMLLDEGAAPNTRNRNGFTALVSAIQNSRGLCAKILIDYGVCVNVDRPKNRFGVTVSLLTFVLFSMGDWEMAEYLLDAGIRPTKFSPPLGFTMLYNIPVPLIRKFVNSGFDVLVKGWADNITHNKEALSDSERELMDLIEYEELHVPCLQRLCRTVIRLELVNSSTKLLHISHKIKRLALPTVLHKYLNLEYL